MKCECGSTQFYASQVCYHRIIVDENGNFIDDLDVDEADHPYGPFECTQCAKEYEEL
jgi:hypothetical protein